MVLFKACEKCRGDLVLEEDSFGAFYKCLQCGKLTEIESKRSSLPWLEFAPKVKRAA